MPKVVFFPATMDGLPRDAPSPRIRARWVCQYWDGAEVYDGSQALSEYDVFVFQKAYLTKTPRQLAARYRGPDRLMAFDCCDPEFADPNKIDRLMRMLDLMDFCVVPTAPLAQWFAPWLPTYIIKDRIDLAVHASKTGDEEPLVDDGIGVLWLGGHQNYPALDGMLPDLQRYGIQLVTLSDRPHPSGLPWIQWESVEQANDVIRRADIVVNPQPEEGAFRYKSDNKTVTAWACGVPVAHDIEELRFLLPLDPQRRLEIGHEYRQKVEQDHDCRISAQEWQEIIHQEFKES